MKIQFLGHACFLLDDGVCKALVDPFLTGIPCGGHRRSGGGGYDLRYPRPRDHVGDAPWRSPAHPGHGSAVPWSWRRLCSSPPASLLWPGTWADGP